MALKGHRGFQLDEMRVAAKYVEPAQSAEHHARHHCWKHYYKANVAIYYARFDNLGYLEKVSRIQ